MATTKEKIVGTRSNNTLWKMTMDADADEIILPDLNEKHDRFSMQVDGITDDEIELYFSNHENSAEPPAVYQQWKNSSGINPWTKDDIAYGAMEFRHAKILRAGGADGVITIHLQFD